LHEDTKQNKQDALSNKIQIQASPTEQVRIEPMDTVNVPRKKETHQTVTEAFTINKVVQQACYTATTQNLIGLDPRDGYGDVCECERNNMFLWW